MKLEQLPAAELEIVEAVEYYQRRSPGLGLAFLEEVKRAYQAIADGPEQWGRVTARTRRFRLARFPYGIVYTAVQDKILVVAVMLLSRRPCYWQTRKQ